MPHIVFIGDELSAAGFRLAGARTLVAAPGTEAETFDAAHADAALILITAEVAACLPPALLARARAAGSPLLLVMADVRGRAAAPDLVRLVRGQLGIES
jgi:vacuolar-type H+-ATPase subunit F/Vma7